MSLNSTDRALRIAFLFKKLYKDCITKQEMEELENWSNESSANKAMFQKLFSETSLNEGLKKLENIETEAAWERVQEKLTKDYTEVVPTVHRVHFLRTNWFRYAAMIILLLGVAAWWQLSRSSGNKATETVVKKAEIDVQPGTNRAILTVGNRSINLATNKMGISVGKSICYTDGEHIADAGQMLLLTTPKGGQYQAVLPDGTKVWLNAASSIRFPSKFTSDRREVEITGEAYLEVAKNTRQPFSIHVNNTTVQVLGTSLNINAYEEEEAERITLVEGSIKVQSKLLKPGQQGIVKQSQDVRIQNADVDQTLAWKNGLFVYKSRSLEEIMKDLSRWYNIQVVYNGKVDYDSPFTGEISRDVPISRLLEMMQLTGIARFRISNKNTVTVYPYISGS